MKAKKGYLKTKIILRKTSNNKKQQMERKKKHLVSCGVFSFYKQKMVQRQQQKIGLFKLRLFDVRKGQKPFFFLSFVPSLTRTECYCYRNGFFGEKKLTFFDWIGLLLGCSIF